jgi:hypothetical protein
MTEEFKIDFNWLSGRGGNPIEQTFYSEIGLAVGGEWLTRLEDLEAKTVRTKVRGCAYRLAMWFAANWWRLRWEPRTSSWFKDTDWRVTHGTACAGGGYVWPNIFFASDGDTISIASLPRTTVAEFEPVHYLNRSFSQISADEFEQKVDLFIEGILSRINSVSIDDEDLPLLWKELMAERSAPETANRRKLEALAGYDPDDAPDELLEQLVMDQVRLGKSAVEEVAAEARHDSKELLILLNKLVVAKHAKPNGFQITVPTISPSGQVVGHPWQRGTALARLARRQWDLGAKPIKNRTLADIISTDPAHLQGDAAEIGIPVAVRKGNKGDFDIYLKSHIATTRRFGVCRIIGDHLYSSTDEKLIPATHTKTSRQKIQRAFAQEFLCPIEALRAMINTEDPDEDDIADAAQYFHVSPLLVRTTLVNKGEIDRESLAWAD